MRIKIFFVLFLAVLPFVSKAQFLGFAYKPFVAAENTPPGWTPSGTSANQGLFGLNVSTYETWRWNGSSWVEKNWDGDNLGNHTATQQLQVTNGTYSAPAITAINDTNTGIQFAGNDTVNITLNGTNRFKAFMAGGTNSMFRFRTPGQAEVDMLTSVQGGAIGTNGNFPFFLMSNWTSRIYISPTGRIGINNNSPSARLHIDGQVRIDSLGTVTPTSILGDLNGVLGRITVGSGLSFTGGTLTASGATPAGSNTQIQFNNSGAFGASSLLIYNTSDSSFVTNLVRIWRGRWNRSGNLAIGAATLSSNTSGSLNTVIGMSAGQNNTTGIQLTAVGANALQNNTTGGANTAIGQNAMAANTIGQSNVGVGAGALDNNTSGNDNTGIGYLALTTVSTGIENTGLGAQALQKSLGSQNTSVGAYSMLEHVVGNDNTAIGFDAGQFRTGGFPIDSISQSVFVGSETKAQADNQTNQIVIGYNATGIGSNTARIGNTSVTKVGLGNIVIKTSPALGSGDDVTLNFILR